MPALCHRNPSTFRSTSNI